jgi:hypothetical protein
MKNRRARTVVSIAAVAVLSGCGPDASALASGTFEVRQLDPPTIGARTPDFILRISGSGFDSGSRVLIGDVELGSFSTSPTTLVGTVPGGTAGTTVPGSLLVSVKNPDGTTAKALPLVVTEAPVPVLSIAMPTNLCAGAGPLNVTISGDNFTTDMTLESNGESVEIATRSRSRLTFSVPRLSGRYFFEVRVPPPGGGSASIGMPTFLGCD